MSYFKVGEECILQSECFPELNGDCVVTRCFCKDTAPHIQADGTEIIKSSFTYLTSTNPPNGCAWAESALRKKHKPSTTSLSTMIEELKKAKV
jgi:hypothetical protein